MVLRQHALRDGAVHIEHGVCRSGIVCIASRPVGFVRFKAYRVPTQSGARPYKGGIRFHKAVSLKSVQRAGGQK